MAKMDENVDFQNSSEDEAKEEFMEKNVTFFPVLKQPLVTAILFASSYSLVFVVGIVGNVTVVCVVLRNPRLHNVTNCFIVNLAVADMLVVLFCLPANLVTNLFAGWHLGSAMCKLVPFLQGVSVAASVSTLTAISVDRYLAICHPLKRCLTKRTVRNTIATIWLLSSITISPWLFSYTLVDSSSPQQTIYVCHDSSTPLFIKVYFFGIIFLMCYFVPLACITVFYSLIAHRVWNRNTENLVQHAQSIYSSKIKVLKMLITVVILFAVFWLPLYATHMRALLHSDHHDAFLQQTLVPIAQWLSSSNSSVNPLVYCLFSKKFRSAFSSTCFADKKQATNTVVVGSRWASNPKSINFSNQSRRSKPIHVENKERRMFGDQAPRDLKGTSGNDSFHVLGSSKQIDSSR